MIQSMMYILITTTRLPQLFDTSWEPTCSQWGSFPWVANFSICCLLKFGRHHLLSFGSQKQQRHFQRFQCLRKVDPMSLHVAADHVGNVLPKSICLFRNLKRSSSTWSKPRKRMERTLARNTSQPSRAVPNTSQAIRNTKPPCWLWSLFRSETSRPWRSRQIPALRWSRHTSASREDVKSMSNADVNPCQLVICHQCHLWEKHALLRYLDLLTNTWTINDHHIKPSHVGTKKPATLGQGEIEVLVQRHATMLLTSHER